MVGAYKNLPNNNDKIFSFLRYRGKHRAMVAVNLSDKAQACVIDFPREKNVKVLWGDSKPVISAQKMNTVMQPYGVGVWEIK